MGKTIRIEADNREIEVSVGDFVFLMRENRQWNIYRIDELGHKQYFHNGEWKSEIVMITYLDWECPYRKNNLDTVFLTQHAIDVFSRASEQEYRIGEKHIKGVYKTEIKAEQVAFAISNAMDGYNEVMKKAHDNFMFLTNLVRHG